MSQLANSSGFMTMLIVFGLLTITAFAVLLQTEFRISHTWHPYEGFYRRCRIALTFVILATLTPHLLVLLSYGYSDSIAVLQYWLVDPINTIVLLICVSALHLSLVATTAWQFVVIRRKEAEHFAN